MASGNLHGTLIAATAPAMSRENSNWTYLTASGQLRERDWSADMSDCITWTCLVMQWGALIVVNWTVFLVPRCLKEMERVSKLCSGAFSIRTPHGFRSNTVPRVGALYHPSMQYPICSSNLYVMPPSRN